ncbi:MAG: nitrate reductase molybdenum cofactor assembly chaperone [Amphritea sp.]
MRSLKVISLLMDYPEAELFEGRQELIEELRSDAQLSEKHKAALIDFIEQLCSGDLLDAQDYYVGMFDRGRSLSLLLFEHVHGESRDRGQAMVNLMSVYEDKGFAIGVRELPDYIPLFLEYLSMRPEEEVTQWLTEVSEILALLVTRLEERESPYAVLFDAVLHVAGLEVDRKELIEKVKNEARDDTPEALDKVWEEEMVSFTEGSAVSGCGDNAVAQRRKEFDSVSVVQVLDNPTHNAQTGIAGS